MPTAKDEEVLWAVEKSYLKAKGYVRRPLYQKGRQPASQPATQMERKKKEICQLEGAFFLSLLLKRISAIDESGTCT